MLTTNNKTLPFGSIQNVLTTKLPVSNCYELSTIHKRKPNQRNLLPLTSYLVIFKKFLNNKIDSLINLE